MKMSKTNLQKKISLQIALAPDAYRFLCRLAKERMESVEGESVTVEFVASDLLEYELRQRQRSYRKTRDQDKELR